MRYGLIDRKVIDLVNIRSVDPTKILIGWLLFACGVGVSFGQSVYKTVDAEGRVTYTTDPPDDKTESQVLDLLSEPSDSEIAKAQKRIERVQEKLEKNQEARAREAERSARAAASGRDTVVVVQPNPTALFYPYVDYRGYRPYRRDYRHRYQHRVIGPYRRHPGYYVPHPSRRYSYESRYRTGW